ncbi:MAG TPA: TolC family protein [Terriglobales bacterium]|jgi:cobalt-zinc-cadmium efflux system outer membrane protein|nr:TolC family protein [Terriglobales bacterium]
MKAVFYSYARKTALSGALLFLSACFLAAQQLQPANNDNATSHPGEAGGPSPLPELVAEAEHNNPEIQAAEHGWKAATHVAGSASALPDTQISLQSFSVGSPRPGAGLSNNTFAYVGLGAAQEIPYPGKRGLRSQVAEREADSLREQSDAVRRLVVEKLKAAYFQLAYLQQTLGILQRNDNLLNDVQQIAESHYRVGQGNQQEVLKAQLQHTKILQEITMHHRDVGQLQAQLKQLLGRPQDSPDIQTERSSTHPLTYSAADLLKAAQEQNPDIQGRAAMAQKAEAQTQLAQKEFRPDFNVQYMFERTGSSFPAYYVATFGINLPNRGRRRAELAQANEEREQANQELRAETQRQLAEVQSQYVLAQTSAEQLKIYQEGLIPQSDATFRSALAAYQSNRQDFESLLSSFMDVLNLQLEYERELADHESALARLESLTGVTLQ